VNQPTGFDGTELMDLLRRQRDLYVCLRRLADRQRRLVADDDPTALLSLLGDRQRLTRELLEVGRHLSPYRESWPATRASLEPSDCREAERMVAESGALLQRIIEDDEQDARLLSARRTLTATRANGLRSERAALSAYASAVGQSGGRFDQTSAADPEVSRHGTLEA